MEVWIEKETKLRKVKGHEFEGVFLKEFDTLDGNVRIIVESTVVGSRGLLFILRKDQMEEVA
jgi:hypothetical protein